MKNTSLPLHKILLLAAIIVVFALTPSNLHAQSTGSVLYMPFLQSTDTQDLGLALSNPNLTEVTATLTAFGYDGKALAGTGLTNPTTMKLPASGQRALRISEIFGTGINGKSGWVEIKSSSSLVKGFFLIFDSALTYIDGTDLQGSPASRLIFPKVSASPRT